MRPILRLDTASEHLVKKAEHLSNIEIASSVQIGIRNHTAANYTHFNIIHYMLFNYATIKLKAVNPYNLVNHWRRNVRPDKSQPFFYRSDSSPRRLAIERGVRSKRVS